MNVIIKSVRYDLTHEPMLRITLNKKGVRATEFSSYGKALRSKQYSFGWVDEKIEQVKNDFGYYENNSYDI